MNEPAKPQPPRQCPVCHVAMQATKTGSKTIHRCERCGTVITVAKSSGGAV